MRKESEWSGTKRDFVLSPEPEVGLLSSQDFRGDKRSDEMFIRKKKIKGRWYYYAVDKKKNTEHYLGDAESIVRKLEELKELKKKLVTLPYNPL